MDANRVVVTGMGAVCAAGHDKHSLLSALQTARCCLTPLTGARAEQLSFRLAGQVPPAQDPPQDRLDSVARFALAAASEAVAESGLAVGAQANVSVIIGTGGGGLESIDAGYQTILTEKRRRPSPFTVPKSMPSAPVSAIAARFGLRGLSFGLSSACASANHAIGLGAWLVRQGMCDAAIVGGSEAPLTLGHLRAWDALRAVSADTCRPFSRDRSGMILGEGAAVLVLEPLHRARERGVVAWAEVAGFGASSGGAEITRPDADGFALAMTRALADGKVSADAVDYVQAHGTATPLNDRAEAAALYAVLGARAAEVPTSSLKAMIGHTIGASGALGLCATLLAMRAGFFPPTVSFTTPDPACALDVVPNAARPGTFRTALCNSFAFGDLNTTLLLRAL